MKRYIIIALILIASLSCTSTPTPTRVLTPAPTNTLVPTAAIAPTATLVPTEYSFSGPTDQATTLFHLNPGLTRFDLTHTGKSTFIVYLLDEHGNQIALVNNTIGAGDSSKAIKIEAEGQYLLNINADGAWTIKVSQ